MTDRMKGCVVTFDRDIRSDDVEYLVNAIRMLKGVLDVELSVAEMEDHMNRIRAQSELIQRVVKAMETGVGSSYKYDLVKKP